MDVGFVIGPEYTIERRRRVECALQGWACIYDCTAELADSNGFAGFSGFNAKAEEARVWLWACYKSS